MRDICLVSPKFCGYIGGMETHGYEFAKFFADNPNNPIRNIFTKEKVEDGVPVGITLHDGTTHNNAAPEWAKSYLKPVLSGDFEKDAQIIINNSNFPETILYLNSPTWAPVCKIIKDTYPTTKIIIRSGGNDIVAGWLGNEKDITKNLEESKKYLVDLVNNSVDYFIVNSEYSYNRTIDAGVDKNKIVKILGGVDCQLFSSFEENLNNTITVVTSARLVKFKGIDYSIAAFKQASQMTKIPTKYVIVGDGPEKNRT